MSIHADEVLHFRFGTETTVAQWTPLAQDGADLPPTMRVPRPALATVGPGETADFTYMPTAPGRMTLEVWIPGGQRRELTVEIRRRKR